MEAIASYAIGVLLLIVVALGTTAYVFHNQKNEFQAQVVTLTTNLKLSEANEELAKKSCAVTQEVTKEVGTKIEVQQTVMTKALEDLAQLPATTESDTSQQESNNVKTPYADDARLSPDLMRVLQSSYCGASPADPTCSAKQSVTNLPSGKTK